MVRTIVRNIAALFTGEMIARVCHFVSVIYIARLFGAAGFGMINFALAFISYFVMATNLGLGEIGVREVSRKRDIGEIAGTILSMRLAIACASYAVIAMSVFFLRKSPETVLIVLAYGLTLFPYAFSLEWVFRGTERMKYNAYGRALNALLYLGLILSFVKQPRDVILVAFITLLADLTSCLFYYRSFARKYGPVVMHLDFKRWLSLASVSAQLFVSSAMLGVYIGFGTIALGFMGTEKDVGIYSAAAKLIFFVYAMSDLFVAAIFPVVSRLYHESREKLDNFLGYCIKITFILGLPIAVGGMALGPQIIQLVYGAAYAGSGPVFRILSWFAAVNLMSFALSYSLVACDRQHLYLKVMSCGALLNVTLNLMLIPVIGYKAPAFALVATEAAVLAASFWTMSRFVSMPSPVIFLRPACAALAMGAVLMIPARLALPVVIVAAIAAYAGVLFLSGGITRREIELLKEAFV